MHAGMQFVCVHVRASPRYCAHVRESAQVCARVRASARMCARVYECACLNKTWLHFSGCIFSGRDLSTV